MGATVDFEVGIIGGGPAGSSLAAYLAKAGVRCIVLEKEQFPREHVGESLVPAAHRVLSEIGMMGKMEEAGFPKKFGAAWSSASSKVYDHDWEGIPEAAKVDIRFDEREMVDRNYTYHVDRAKFDLLLLENAASLGATVLQQAKVLQVQLEAREYPLIRYRHQGEDHAVQVRLVVDASGRNTMLGSQLKLKRKDPNFDQYAVHTWYKDFDRGPGPKQDYIFVHFLPIPNSWVWQIPITADITSIGLVTQKKYFSGSKEEREAFFHECLKKYPGLHDRVMDAERLRPFKSEGNYSYAMEAFAGDGWALIGDAARFTDPIFSSGVSVALNSARFLFLEIVEKLRTEADKSPFTRADLEGYEQIIKRGVKNWYAFISLYYRLNVVFTKFVNSPKYRLDILKLLSGDVYEEDTPAVLEEMKLFVEQVEQNPNHILHGLLREVNGVKFAEPTEVDRP